MLETNKIYQGDALMILKIFPNESVDCVVTSPPYDNLRSYQGYEFNFEGIVSELYRVIKNGGIMVWIVGDATIDNSETGTSFKQALYCKEIGFNLHDTMIYEKNGASYPTKNKYYQVFEYMFILSKGIPKTVNLLYDRKNLWGGSWGKRSRRDVKGNLIQEKRIESRDKSETGIRFNIWRYNTGQGFSTKDEIAFEHPAIFPEELATDHIKSWSNEGDLILDPMCGSGTTCKMAKILSRNFIGIDISEKYCKIAEARLSQNKLF